MKNNAEHKSKDPVDIVKMRGTVAAKMTTPCKVDRSVQGISSRNTTRHAPTEIEDIRDAVSRLKRERIISVAVELFYHNGFNNTTLEAVAEKINVTKPFIYSHFKSKNDLLAEICSRGIRASLEVLNQIVATGHSPTEKVRSLVHDFTLAVLENQEAIAIYMREQKHLSKMDSEVIEEMRREFDRKLCALLEDGIATGEFTVPDVRITSLAVGGIVSWSCVWFRPHGRLKQVETAEHVSDLVLAMIQAKSNRRKRARAAVETA
ncbi:TetR/AcrR family transcriptional regulator [Glaciimonas sp. Gout2]|uniref:TetR/AcrR family transcriptional regulator n=1 Tax=unclassified Glaciimonas TaxID=2644401 RepID=UPI002B234676|nr:MULTISPECIES: TetR/AcrR family transcriptional regulator [unclassified Glaciimonas]MEB0011227.1 TetR/AcrR family transcriptional regulator [Glaciimonas sp. Cout2]MEB0084552.1 TetR/AcrR family transcriptional regulator [Glaciimonas sp. Gout2]